MSTRTILIFTLLVMSQTCSSNVIRENHKLTDVQIPMESLNSPLGGSSRFRLDPEGGTFRLDGTPTVLLGGDMQYYRTPRAYWRRRLRSMRRAGLNTVHVAVEWSTHEPAPGVFRFTGEEDFVLFIRLAQEEGLLVVVRPGPFVDDERDFGGHPAWLLWDTSHAASRVTDPAYRASVTRYMGEMLTRLKPLLVDHGGPVVMLEVECDVEEHAAWLASLLRRHMGEGVVVVDRGDRVGRMEGAAGAGSYLRDLAYKLYDAATDTRPLTYSMRKILPGGPRLADYTTAWGSLWGYHARPVMTSEEVTAAVREAVRENMSICISSFHGGTDFGFKAGAWIQPVTGAFAAQTTSHDVAAPLDEAGDETDLYFAVADALNSAIPRENREPAKRGKQLSVGPISLRPVACLLDNATITALSSRTVRDKIPQSFEELRQASGFVLYETVIARDYDAPVLRTPELRDRAQIYINQKFQGILSRAPYGYTMYLPDLAVGDQLQIFVENQGRTYWGSTKNFMHYKGLSYGGDVRLSKDTLYGWTSHGYPLDDVGKLHGYADRVENVTGGGHDAVQGYADRVENDTGGGHDAVRCTPTLYAGEFVLPVDTSDPIPDTYLHLHTNWSKGVAFVNGHNLGRYWPTVGPQVTLYLPGCHLRPAPLANKLLVLELQHEVADRPIAELVHSHVAMAEGSQMGMMSALAALVLMSALVLMFTSGMKYANWVRRV